MTRRARLLLLSIGGAAVATAIGCERVAYYSIGGENDEDGANGPGPATVGPGGGGEPQSITRAMVLDTAAKCAVSLYADAATRADELSVAASAYADDPSDETRDAARVAWREAIAAWQQAEILRVGPAGPVSTPSGQGLRDYVYSWPLVSRCLVEQTLVNEGYASDDFQDDALINIRGLAAAEYLLFFEPEENACGPNSSINTSGSWASILGAELTARKQRYAAVVASDVAFQVKGLHAAWSPDGGDFGATLASAGQSDSPFKSDQAALNALSDGMFYIEREVKDMKLGRPLGKVECAEASCPAAVESQYARVARDHIKNNLIGFQRVFEGCTEAADGFDDLLRGVGAADLANDMSSSIQGAITAADALSTSDLVAALSEERDKVEALHAAVKKVTDLLKTDFVTVLDLDKPIIVEGDND